MYIIKHHREHTGANIGRGYEALLYYPVYIKNLKLNHIVSINIVGKYLNYYFQIISERLRERRVRSSAFKRGLLRLSSACSVVIFLLEHANINLSTLVNNYLIDTRKLEIGKNPPCHGVFQSARERANYVCSCIIIDIFTPGRIREIN